MLIIYFWEYHHFIFIAPNYFAELCDFWKNSQQSWSSLPLLMHGWVSETIIGTCWVSALPVLDQMPHVSLPLWRWNNSDLCWLIQHAVLYCTVSANNRTIPYEQVLGNSGKEKLPFNRNSGRTSFRGASHLPIPVGAEGKEKTAERGQDKKQVIGKGQSANV